MNGNNAETDQPVSWTVSSFLNKRNERVENALASNHYAQTFISKLVRKYGEKKRCVAFIYIPPVQSNFYSRSSKLSGLLSLRPA